MGVSEDPPEDAKRAFAKLMSDAYAVADP